MQKVLNAIQRVRFTKSTQRHASIEEKYESFFVSDDPTLQNARIGPTKRLDDNSDVPKASLGILPKYMFKLKVNDKATFFSPAEKWVLPSVSAREPEEREFAVDSGTSMHVVSEKDLNTVELATKRTSRSPTTVMTANGNGVRRTIGLIRQSFAS